MKLAQFTRVLLLLSGIPCCACAAYTGTAVDSYSNDHFTINARVGSVTSTTVNAIIMLDIQKGWHIYASDPGDVGMPTRLWFDDTTASDLDVFWPKFVKSFDKVGSKVLKSNIYEGTVAFPITFKIAYHPNQVQLHMSFAVCGEACIPKKVSLDISPLSDVFEDREVLDLIKEWRHR